MARHIHLIAQEGETRVEIRCDPKAISIDITADGHDYSVDAEHDPASDPQIEQYDSALFEVLTQACGQAVTGIIHRWCPSYQAQAVQALTELGAASWQARSALRAFIYSKPHTGGESA